MVYMLHGQFYHIVIVDQNQCIVPSFTQQHIKVVFKILVWHIWQKTDARKQNTWTICSIDCTHRCDNVPVIGGYRTARSSLSDFLPLLTSAWTGSRISPVAAFSAISSVLPQINSCSECSHVATAESQLDVGRAESPSLAAGDPDASTHSGLSSLSTASATLSSSTSLDCKATTTTASQSVNYQLTFAHGHTHTFNGPFPGLPKWAGTRKVKPIWILLKQKTVSGTGISWAICKSAPRSRQITTPAPHHMDTRTSNLKYDFRPFSYCIHVIFILLFGVRP